MAEAGSDVIRSLVRHWDLRTDSLNHHSRHKRPSPRLLMSSPLRVGAGLIAIRIAKSPPDRGWEHGMPDRQIPGLECPFARSPAGLPFESLPVFRKLHC